MNYLLLLLHCLYTPRGRKVSPEEVLRWHTAPKPEGRGWNAPGSRGIIHLSGALSILRDYDFDDTLEGWEITNGALGHNAHSIHLALVGGMERGQPANTFTERQWMTLEYQVLSYLELYPDIKVGGHNQVSQKACPCFDVPEFCRGIGVPAKNILT